MELLSAAKPDLTQKGLLLCPCPREDAAEPGLVGLQLGKAHGHSRTRKVPAAASAMPVCLYLKKLHVRCRVGLTAVFGDTEKR